MQNGDGFTGGFSPGGGIENSRCRFYPMTMTYDLICDDFMCYGTSHLKTESRKKVRCRPLGRSLRTVAKTFRVMVNRTVEVKVMK